MEKIKLMFPAIVSARITEKQKEKIERLASKLNLSKSEFLRDFLTNILMKLP